MSEFETINDLRGNKLATKLLMELHTSEIAAFTLPYETLEDLDPFRVALDEAYKAGQANFRDGWILSDEELDGRMPWREEIERLDKERDIFQAKHDNTKARQ